MHNVIANQGDQHLSKNDSGLKSTDPRQRAWVEVNPAAIEANARKISCLLDKNCSLMAVVKADGYGHGAQTVAIAALRGGANSLGVATLQEGIELRKVGIDCPILVLGNLIHDEELSACLDWRLMPTLSSLREVRLCHVLSKGASKNFLVQLKVDTGMTRLGCSLEIAQDLIKTIDELSHIELKGVYSHLALADEDQKCSSGSFTQLQKARFDELVHALPKRDKDFCFHLANSAGTLRDRGLHYDMVRVGLALYGYSPSCELQFDLDLQPALAVKARVTLVREVPAGIGVSYGHRFTTNRPSRLAVVGIGYADGVNRALSGKISALFNGRSIPQVGAITMDQLVLDITDHRELNVGSVVTLLGRDGGHLITPKHWSDLIGSIPWEVLCGFKHRLPRLVI